MTRSVTCPRMSAEAYLRAADPVLGALIDAVGPDGLGDARDGRPDDHYGALRARDRRPAALDEGGAHDLRAPDASATAAARRRRRELIADDLDAAARRGRPVESEGVLPALARRARRQRRAGARAPRRDARRGGRRRAGRRQGPRPVDGRHVPDVPPAAAPTSCPSATSASDAPSSAPTRCPACPIPRSSPRSPSRGARTARWRAGTCGGAWTTSRPERSAAAASDGADLLLVRDAERGAAAAGGDHVRVVDLEAGALEVVDVVDRRALARTAGSGRRRAGGCPCPRRPRRRRAAGRTRARTGSRSSRRRARRRAVRPSRPRCPGRRGTRGPSRRPCR